MASFSEHLIAAQFETEGLKAEFDATRRVRSFRGMGEISEAGFPASSFVFKAAQKQFAQSPHIGRVFVGLKLPDENWTEALSAIRHSNNEWYALTVSTRTMSEQQEVALWTEANQKLCILASSDGNIVNAETGDIGAWASLMNLDRAAVFYHPDAGADDDPIPEAAYFGKMLTKHPGSATWALKSLNAVPTYALSGAQSDAAQKKHATTYMDAAGIPITSDGRVASGEFIDVIQGVDWLRARIQNLVFTPMSQQDKIPFTDTGVQIIVSQVRAALDEGVKREILASYEIDYPKVAEVAPNFKGARTLPDVKFRAPLAGAIHRTVIDGTVTL
jgi:hypothetical protein